MKHGLRLKIQQLYSNYTHPLFGCKSYAKCCIFGFMWTIDKKWQWFCLKRLFRPHSVYAAQFKSKHNSKHKTPFSKSKYTFAPVENDYIKDWTKHSGGVTCTRKTNKIERCFNGIDSRFGIANRNSTLFNIGHFHARIEENKWDAFVVEMAPVFGMLRFFEFQVFAFLLFISFHSEMRLTLFTWA